MKNHTNTLILALVLAVASFIPELAFAQDVFKAPTSFLTDIQTFITGPGGVLLAGAIIGVTAVMAATPRSAVNWGHFFLVLIVLCVLFGGYKIAEVIQKANT